jgi:nucleotide-binding universal stress UspA family protein
MVREEMAALAQKLSANGLVAVAGVTSGTDAANEIIQTTKDSAIDLIVMSSHGRSGLGRWLIGSVAEKVLRYGETPLLLVNVTAS